MTRRAQGRPDAAGPERAGEEAGSARRRAEAKPEQPDGLGGSHPPRLDDDAIALVDYGAGNLRSVENALQAVGARVQVTHDAAVVRAAGRIVVPGQGSLPACVEAMRQSGVAAALTAAVARGAKVLGICVGLEILFEKGEEGGGSEGLGLVPGTVSKLPAGVKLPHIGWSPVRAVGMPHPLFAPLDGQYVYFAHSYAGPADVPGVQLVAVHGRPFCAALAAGSLFAVQFHPEKSQRVGLEFLDRFVRL